MHEKAITSLSNVPIQHSQVCSTLSCGVLSVYLSEITNNHGAQKMVEWDTGNNHSTKSKSLFLQSYTSTCNVGYPPHITFRALFLNEIRRWMTHWAHTDSCTIPCLTKSIMLSKNSVSPNTLPYCSPFCRRHSSKVLKSLTGDIVRSFRAFVTCSMIQ
jgi:hypothetical protein